MEDNYHLHRLERVDPRTVWTREDGDFTPWLAANIDLLGEALGMELCLEAEEKHVGPIRADILAKEVFSNKWVLIENQLERTDHTHLGQLLVYAAGLNASVVVWVARLFTDEHLAALDWLNGLSANGVGFFGIQINLWRVENAIAPQFLVVSRPNSWLKRGAEMSREIEVDDAALATLDWYTVKQAAKYLKCTDRWLRDLRARMPSPLIWDEGIKAFTGESVRAYAQSRVVAPVKLISNGHSR